MLLLVFDVVPSMLRADFSEALNWLNAWNLAVVICDRWSVVQFHSHPTDLLIAELQAMATKLPFANQLSSICVPGHSNIYGSGVEDELAK